MQRLVAGKKDTKGGEEDSGSGVKEVRWKSLSKAACDTH